ncbi:MAG: double-strand break repair helicase AddA [Rickettsiales bacterium]|nr:double-strand break repair helicase AddA [Rickettsiales bacterium]
MSAQIDPNIAQREASNPAASVWVAASAGSGKTKVLTDRVLRLLLSGTLPSRILCITYTKAAAAEMQSRIFAKLSAWAIMPQAELLPDLESLMAHPPTQRIQQQARRLFTEALEDSPGLRIQTIHSFCQSVLARFPLEAGVPPNFSVLDERTAGELLEIARLKLLNGQHEAHTPDDALQEALAFLTDDAGETSFNELVQAIIQNRRSFMRVLSQSGGLSRARTNVYSSFAVDPLTTPADLQKKHFSYSDDQKKEVRELAAALLEGLKTDIEYSRNMQAFLQSDFTDSIALNDYLQAFLTKEKAVRRLPTKGVQKKHPLLTQCWQKEAKRCVDYTHEYLSLQHAHSNAHILTLAHALFHRYEQQKRLRGMLDYDDLILHTCHLLCDTTAGSLEWVLYKLDGGLDHLLLDEAQDTSQEQWSITRRLVEDFFAGMSARDTERTLFVVGDSKQSIYRFQGAEPEGFFLMQQRFAEQITASRHIWQHVELNVSFRTVPCVLEVVDATFSKPGMLSPIDHDHRHAIQHVAYRTDQPGRVELWPVIVPQKKTRDAWSLPEHEQSPYDATHALAQRIARTIRQWLDEGRCLAATNKPVTPADIIILMRKRSALTTAITNALRQHDIPVSGLDRLALKDALAAQDMMALGHTMLLPQSDLMLAGLLKSPAFRLNEEELFTLCHDRKSASVWQRLMGYTGPNETIGRARDELQALHRHCLTHGHGTPYEFYADLLHAKGMMQRFVARMGHGVQEILEVFLEQARQYEHSHPPSLQGFLHWMEQSEGTIKRDMEQGANEVRIMTVHGAKGLEAPIVFLPDAANNSKSTKRHFVKTTTGPHAEEMFLRLPTMKEDTPLSAGLRELKEAADNEEFHRLLYVAMTRARDELYIAGISPEKVNEKSWYHHIRAGMQSLQNHSGFSKLTVPPCWHHVSEKPEEILCYTTGETVVTHNEPNKPNVPTLLPLPATMFTLPPPEALARRRLNPSQLLEQMESAMSPASTLISKDEHEKSGLPPLQRGILIHRLLHLLSVVEPARRQVIATHYLQRYQDVLPPSERQSMVQHLLLLMHDPIYAPIFSTRALCEVSVSGLLESSLGITQSDEPIALSGQIDRLLVMEDRVLIIDFKTGELPAYHTTKGYLVPELYRRQMEAYRQLLQRIYPDKTIETALIYTAIPMLLPVPATLTRAQASAI